MTNPPTALPNNPLTRPLAGLLLCASGVAAFLGNYWAITSGLPVLAGTVAGYAGLMVLLTSLADRFDARPAGAYRDFGRNFLGLGLAAAAFALGLATTQTKAVSDLLMPQQAILVGAITATLIAVFVYLLGTRPDNTTPAQSAKTTPTKALRHGDASAGHWAKGLLALVLVAAAAYLLNQRLSEHQTQQDAYEQSDAQERAKAPPWRWSFNDFAPGTPRTEIQARLSRAGYSAHCPQRQLASNEKILPGDQHNCWALLKLAHDLPARVASFGFDEHGLSAQLIRYEPEQWGAVSRHLDATAQRLDANFGRSDALGPAVIGWRFDNGLVMSAESGRGEDITVLWMARDIFLREECADRQKALAAGQRRPKVPVENWWPGIECGALAP